MKIFLSELALENLENLKAYIFKNSESYAEIFIEMILKKIKNLESFPFIGRILPEQDNENLREILFHNYRIIYLIEQKRISILTIVHGSREDFDLG